MCPRGWAAEPVLLGERVGGTFLGDPDGEVTWASSLPALINSHLCRQLCQEILRLLSLGPAVWWLMCLLRGGNFSGEQGRGESNTVRCRTVWVGGDAEEFPKLRERGLIQGPHNRVDLAILSCPTPPCCLSLVPWPRSGPEDQEVRVGGFANSYRVHKHTCIWASARS